MFDHKASPLDDPIVQQALLLSAKNARDEERQDAMLDHLGRIDGHLALMNGRILKSEEAHLALATVVSTHLTQVEARDEFGRLVAAETALKGINKRLGDGDVIEATTQAVNKRDLAILGAGLAAVMGVADVLLKPVIERLLF